MVQALCVCDDIYFKFSANSYQNKNVDENLKDYSHALLDVLLTVGDIPLPPYAVVH